MARPIKEGLDYFPLNVDIDSDDKFAMVEALHGLEGFGIAIKLLMKIYKEGYFYEWTNREQILFSKRVNVDRNQVIDVVNDCINEGLFNKKIFNEYSILTSKGIQKRYLEAVKRRKEVSFLERYYLIDDIKPIIGTSNIAVFVVDDNGKRVNVNINSINDNISTQRKEKKRKEKKSKVNNSINSEEPEPEETPKTEPPKNDNKKQQQTPFSIIDNDFKTMCNALIEYNIIGPLGLNKAIGDDWEYLKQQNCFFNLSELVLEAIKITARENPRAGWNWVYKKLGFWHKDQIRSLKDLEAHSQQKEFNANKKGGYNRKPIRTEKDPDWTAAYDEENRKKDQERQQPTDIEDWTAKKALLEEKLKKLRAN